MVSDIETILIKAEPYDFENTFNNEFGIKEEQLEPDDTKIDLNKIDDEFKNSLHTELIIKEQLKLEEIGEENFSNNNEEKNMLFGRIMCNKNHVSADENTLKIENFNETLTYDICNKQFKYNSTLIEHRRNHKPTKPFICKICCKLFQHKDELSLHERRHQKNLESKHECLLCHKRFMYLNLLLRHQRMHTGENQHVCQTCGRTFVHQYNLTVHELTHTDEKPLQCTYCDEVFTQKQALRKHTRSHVTNRIIGIGKTPYKIYKKKTQLGHHKKKTKKQVLKKTFKVDKINSAS